MENNINELLRTVKAKIESHNEFKNAYDRQLAFDFNLLNFFKVGENKTSEIIAYFLNPKQKHGQGDAFLNIFLEHYVKDIPVLKDISELDRIKCEYTIKDKRRIDIYMKFVDGKIIAIENKIWASDQNQQVTDYTEFLKDKTKNKFVLIYLTPYGHEPSTESISMEDREKMKNDGNLKISSYKHDFLEIINQWIAVSEADNVTYFLKQFKHYLEVKFLGNSNLNLNKMMENIIKENKNEIVEIVNAYNELREKNEKRFDKIVSKLASVQPDLKKKAKNQAVDLELQGPFYDKRPVSHSTYKAARMRLKKGEDRIKVHFKCDFINFYISHFKEISEEKSHFSDIIDVTDWDSEKIINEIKKSTEYSIKNFDSLLRDDQDFSIPL